MCTQKINKKYTKTIDMEKSSWYSKKWNYSAITDYLMKMDDRGYEDEYGTFFVASSSRIDFNSIAADLRLKNYKFDQKIPEDTNPEPMWYKFEFTER